MSEFRKREADLFNAQLKAKGSERAVDSMNRAERRRAQATTRKAVTETLDILKKENEGGAGLLMDAQLREFWREFNSRSMNHGLDSLPTAYNVVGSMMSLDRERYIFRLLPEHDHVFSWTDFVDFVTSKDAPGDALAEAAKLPEREVYAFNAYDDPHDLMFSSGGEEYAVGGVSFVRHGDEISLMLVAGQLANLDKADEHVAEVLGTLETGVEYKPGLRADPSLRTEAVSLSDYGDLHKTIALTRIDISKREATVRYVLIDNGNFWEVKADDATIFAGTPRAYVASQMDHLGEEVQRRAVLFDLARTALLLPAYFRFRLALVRDERVAPPQRNRRDGGMGRKRPPKYDGPLKYRTVPALRILNSAGIGVARRFSPPQFRVEVSGFWRTLADGAVGKDPSGEPVIGRTWVADHERWTDRPERPKEVLVKSRVAIARRIVETERLVREAAARPAQKASPEPPQEKTPLQPALRVSREDAYQQRRLLTTRLRWAILSRDNFRCTRCGADAVTDAAVRIEVDHVDPVANGGKTVPENLKTLCSRCNNGKGTSLESL